MRLIRLTFVLYGKLLVYESNEELAVYRYEYTGTRGEWKQSFVALRPLRKLLTMGVKSPFVPPYEGGKDWLINKIYGLYHHPLPFVRGELERDFDQEK
jgi:hypothetical protein